MIADLHCDLLLYLQSSLERTPYDREVRCSLPHLRSGKVKLQTLAIFTETSLQSVTNGTLQNQIFHSLLVQYPHEYKHLLKTENLTDLRLENEIQNDTKIDKKETPILIMRAIENASAFCTEFEPLETGLKRLHYWTKEGPIAYISLTWNFENRFGGGAHTSIGLKKDGKSLLEFLHQKRIAVDLSHASDFLAYDIIDYLNAHKLQIPILASHSNCRAVTNVPRNLPDGLIKEIVQRDGVIGLNFVKTFLLSQDPHPLASHLKHLLDAHAENHICFGADFFFEEDLPPPRKPAKDYFFDEYANSSSYPEVLKLWKKELGLPQPTLNDIAYNSLFTFLAKHVL